MTATNTGWVLFASAAGMMLGLLAIDIAKILTWDELYAPGFVANVFGHLATVITAFVGGRLIPTAIKKKISPGKKKGIINV